MRRTWSCLLLLLLLRVVTVLPAFADRAHDLAEKAREIQPERCKNVKTSTRCHANYPGGCSMGSNPGYDAYLNYLKNQDYAHVSPPEDATKGETSNCQLTGDKNSDYHIGIGFDPDTAGKLRQGAKVSRALLQQTSIIVEMTPHYRAQYQPTWSIQRVGKAVGRQAKVIGQLMIDNEHINAAQNCGHPDANLRTCWRRSVWEIHPIIELYVCIAATPCADISHDWKPLAEID